MKSSIDHEKIFFNYFLTKPHYLKGTGKGFFANRDLDLIAKLSKDFYLKGIPIALYLLKIIEETQKRIIGLFYYPILPFLIICNLTSFP